MLLRLAANAAVHAVAGVAVAGLAAVAAEGWRRAYLQGSAGPDPDGPGANTTSPYDDGPAPETSPTDV